MRVLIDASPLLMRSAGVKTYLWNWIRNLRAQAATGETIAAFPFLGDTGPLLHDRSVLGPLGTWPRLATVFASNLPASPLLRLVAGRPDIFHVSNQIRRNLPRTRITATIYDLTVWTMPELHTAANVQADRSAASAVFKKAVSLIAISENTRQDAIRFLRIPEERITTIHCGIADAYFDAAPRPSEKPYVLYTGTIEPRKNVDTLLDAWSAMRFRNEFDLVIIGSPGWHCEQTLARLNSGTAGVRYLGYIPESDLPGWTAGAVGFIYPSLYEGFGLPVGQAMAAGVPVITSNTSCLPEVAGGGALYVDPRSAAELRSALERLLESAELRMHLGQAGRQLARDRYRWSRNAQLSLEFFRRVAGRL